MSEHQEQALVIQWAKLNELRYPELRWLYAVPNAARRGKILAARMKREGLKAGVLDLVLPCARGGFNALYVEMKRLKPIVRADNTVRMKATPLSAAQEEWAAGLRVLGNCVVVCYTAEEAQAAIEAYLESKYMRLSA